MSGELPEGRRTRDYRTVINGVLRTAITRLICEAYVLFCLFFLSFLNLVNVLFLSLILLFRRTRVIRIKILLLIIVILMLVVIFHSFSQSVSLFIHYSKPCSMALSVSAWVLSPGTLASHTVQRCAH